MALSVDSPFFPSLGKILGGHEQLISWETAASGLSTDDAKHGDLNLEKFISDPTSIDILSNASSAFQPATSQTKAAFDTRTAAINITPDTKGLYSIDDIKEDALWLSKQSKIDEVTSLRIIVLEWQTRAANRILTGIGDEDPLDVGALASSILVTSSNRQSFDSKESRRLRILRTYLSERVFLIKTSELLLQSSAAQQTASRRGQETIKGGSRRTWIEKIAATLFNARKEGEKDQNSFLRGCVDALRTRMSSMEHGSGTTVEENEESEEIEQLWVKTQIVEMIHIMQSMFIMIAASTTITSSTTLLAWLQFAASYGFFDGFEPPFQSLLYLVTPLQSLVAMVSLSILNLPTVVSRISEPDNESPHGPYISDLKNIAEISQIFMNAAEARSRTASPAVLAWSIILQTLRETVLSRKEVRELRQSMKAINGFEDSTETEVDSSATDTGESRSQRRQSGDSDMSFQPTIYDEVLQIVSTNRLREDSIRFLARIAVSDCQVFEIITSLVSNYEASFGLDGTGTCNEARLILLELIQSTVQAVEYLPEVVLATLAVLNPQKSAPSLDPATMFLNDAVLMGNMFKAAISRFPYETVPFLRLVRALSASREVDSEGTLKATTILEEMKTFTQALPKGFDHYNVTYEDRNENFVRLSQTLDIFEKRTGQDLFGDALAPREQAFVIPIGTLGRIITDQKPAVGLWYLDYSGLHYLGRLLQTGLSGSNVVDHGTGNPLDHESMAEIVGLLADLMNNSMQVNGDGIAAQRILEEASDGLEQNSDIITVVFDIFEEHLESHADGSTDILSSCMHFISALIRVLPGRVWPFLARSSLLEIDGNGGKLVAVVAASEIPCGRYDFLLASVRVYDLLVEDAVVHAIARKTTKSGRRNVRPEVLGAGVPDTVIQKVLDAFQRIMVDVLQNSSNWKFAVNDDRNKLCQSLVSTFDRILLYCFGIDDSSDPQAKVTGVLSSAAEYLLGVYLSSGSVPVDQLLEMIITGTRTPSTTLFPRSLSLWTSKVSAAVKFVTSLLQLRRLTDRQPSYLEAQLFDNAPILARLYAGHSAYKIPVLDLLRCLVLGAAVSNEPPSLLGHLGPDTAKDFLEILSRLDGPLGNDHLYVRVWDLLSAIVSGGQQWFSVYLLTGKTPRGSLKDSNSGATRQLARPMLGVALDAATVESSSSKNLALLEFITRSMDCWPWAINDLRKHRKFISSITTFINKLQPPSGSQTDSQNLQTCEQISVAALIAQILAMYNHFSRQMGDSATKTISQSIKYFVDNAVNLPSYNLSLHGNLKRNFQMKYNCTLSNFKKTRLTPQRLGANFFYDDQIADKMLSFEEAWHGKRGNNGLAVEIRKANINLSVVESQVALLRNWKLLAIELSTAIKDEPDLAKSLSTVAQQCLRSNAASNVPESIFRQLTQTRADLALALMQQFTQAKVVTPGMKDMLVLTWDIIRTTEISLDIALTGDGADYFRTLLRILLLAIQVNIDVPRSPGTAADRLKPIKPTEPASPKTIQILVDILTHLVATGMRSLAGSIHEAPASSQPADLALLTSLLRACLRVPGIDLSHTTICSHFAEANSARVAATLFSWSDQLLVQGEPVYGELSIHYLVELSGVPLLAGEIAADGVLNQLSNARLMRFIRNSLEPLNHQHYTLYDIWTSGILPICLNLLTAVGPGIASDVAAFLSTFNKHLLAASSFFASKRLTLSMASEAHSLALITTILDKYRAVAPTMGFKQADLLQWDKSQVRVDLSEWIDNRSGLRAAVTPTTEMQLRLASEAGVADGSRLEELVYRELVASLAVLEKEE